MDLLGIRKAVLLRPVCIIGPLQDAGWVGFLQFYFVVVFFPFNPASGIAGSSPSLLLLV